MLPFALRKDERKEHEILNTMVVLDRIVKLVSTKLIKKHFELIFVIKID